MCCHLHIQAPLPPKLAGSAYIGPKSDDKQPKLPRAILFDVSDSLLDAVMETAKKLL